MVITREMALASLRPAFDEWHGPNAPTEQEINAEKQRLDKNATENEKKALRRKVHPASADDLLEEVEALKTTLATVQSQLSTALTRISTLEGRKN